MRDCLWAILTLFCSFNFAVAAAGHDLAVGTATAALLAVEGWTKIAFFVWLLYDLVTTHALAAGSTVGCWVRGGRIDASGAGDVSRVYGVTQLGSSEENSQDELFGVHLRQNSYFRL